MVGPSPRKRRADKAPVSAEAIAQANSTLQIFTGQKHRWMQQDPDARNDLASRVNAPAATRAPQLPHSGESGQGTGTSSHPANVNVVAYDSPSTNNTTITAASPSAVPSASTAHSPPVPTTSRVLPSQSASSTHGENHGPEDMQSSWRVPLQTQQQQHAQIVAAMQQQQQSTGRVQPRRQQQPVPIVPSHPPSHQPRQPSIPFDPFSSDSMGARLESFRHHHLRQSSSFSLDQGRMALLRNAIDQGDWFYIILSQIHTLKSQDPSHLPKCVKDLKPKSFDSLNQVLCANAGVSPQLLQFLSSFPLPIADIYRGPNGATYDTYAQAIASFMQRLATSWEAFVQKCISIQAPPLVEELVEIFSLKSPVLQSTIFRAIARLIWKSEVGGGAGEAIEKLTTLHALNYVQVTNGYMRGPQARAHAYQALRLAFQAWLSHLTNLTHYRQQDQHSQRKTLPPEFRLPDDTVKAFEDSAATQQVRTGHQPSYATTRSNTPLRRAQDPPANGLSNVPPSTQLMNVSLNPNMVQPMLPQSQKPGQRIFFPHETEEPRAQPTQPDTTRGAMHQAHLRSPVLSPSQPELSQPLLYRYIKGFARFPERLNPASRVSTMRFNISAEDFAKIPPTLPAKDIGSPPTRELTEASLTYRLLCKAIPTKGFPGENAWVEADNVWPDNMFLECNEKVLEPRRKLHHGRYLPIDLTTFVESGENRLTVIVNRMSGDARPFDFALAVETVGVKNHEEIKSDLPTISVEKSLSAIKKSLSASDDDDDIAITSSNVTIKLFDPFTNAKIFDIPVRGRDCLHRDCFDLETFLGSRKREEVNWPTTVDCWRCPICRGDARPHRLIVDGFLVQVREYLAAKQSLETRAIVVEENGCWKPKEEKRTGVRSSSVEQEESRRASSPSRRKASPPATMEVIDISD